MNRLVRVELTRLVWRRAVVILLVLAVLLPAAVFVLRVLDTRTQTLDQVAASNGSYVLDEVQNCVDRPRQYDVAHAEDVQLACEEKITGWYGNSPLDLREEREAGGALAALLLLGMLMLLAGITFAGHDWSTGSMSNQLLFEPRRARVWAAKAVAVALVAGVVSFAVLVAFWTGLWATVSIRDLPIQDGAVAAGYKQTVLGAAFVVFTALLGYALTMLLRSTVATIGVLFAVGFLCLVMAGFLGLDGSGVERVMPWGNFYAYAVGSYRFYDYDACNFTGDCPRQLITRLQSVVYFAVLLGAVSVPSFLAHRARDVP